MRFHISSPRSTERSPNWTTTNLPQVDGGQKPSSLFFLVPQKLLVKSGASRSSCHSDRNGGFGIFRPQKNCKQKIARALKAHQNNYIVPTSPWKDTKKKINMKKHTKKTQFQIMTLDIQSYLLRFGVWMVYF